jgi:hypothetical protein
MPLPEVMVIDVVEPVLREQRYDYILIFTNGSTKILRPVFPMLCHLSALTGDTLA